MRRIISSALVASVGLVAVTGCTSTRDDSSEASVSRDGVNAAYRASIAELKFPRGYAPPRTVADIDDDPAGTTYQETYGDTRAHFVWQCAWEQEWLDARDTDPVEAELALGQLGTASSMDYLADSRADDATRGFLAENLEKARLGDPSGMQEDVDVNCS